MVWFHYHKLAIYSQKIWQHMATMSENRILLEFDGVNHGYGAQAAVVTGEKSQEAGIPIFFRWVVGESPHDSMVVVGKITGAAQLVSYWYPILVGHVTLRMDPQGRSFLLFFR